MSPIFSHFEWSIRKRTGSGVSGPGKICMWTPVIRYGAKRSLRTKTSLIPLKELKNGKRNNSQSQSSNPHPNPIENIKCSFYDHFINYDLTSSMISSLSFIDQLYVTNSQFKSVIYLVTLVDHFVHWSLKWSRIVSWFS